ncbi:OmcA/MtrC family decaheme c-type cytochrome [Pseudomonadota bacterium]
MKLFWSLLVSTACICGATNLAAKSDAVDDGYYTTKDKEFYLTPEQLLFIRPGLVVEILDVVIPADMQLEVTFSIQDSGGLPLDYEGIHTPGEVDMRFTLANIPMGEEQKVRLAYERTSRNGTLTSVSPGVYKYKFDTVLASDMDTTHTLVLGFRRDLGEFDMPRYSANDLQNWVPSGMYDAIPRDVVTADTCNRCHDPLSEHGSRWLSPAACGQCHNPTLLGRNGEFVPEASLDVLIHAVHEEAHGYPAELNDCEVCHTGGTPTDNFPLVASPSAALVCDGSGIGQTVLTWEHTNNVQINVRSASDPSYVGLFALGGPTGSQATGEWVTDGTYFDILDMNSKELLQTVTVNTTVLGCVGNPPGTFMGTAAEQHTNWLDHPSRLVCGSCHNDIDFEEGLGHLKQTTDSGCRFCHKADTGIEYDISVKGSHLALYKSSQLPGLLVDILDVTNTNPGDNPTVTFSLVDKYGPVAPASLAFFRIIIAGPNDDYSFLAEEFAGGAVPVDGNWEYTFNTPLPLDSEGSFTAGAELFNMEPVDMGGDAPAMVRHTSENPVFVFAVTDDDPMPRRMVVDDMKCESCHSNLALHGTIRHEAQYCTTCHMPGATDIGEVQEGNMEQSIHFKYMVHKIHRGEELENGYVVAGHLQSIHDYSEVEYPGDLRNCNACHEDNSQQLSLPEGVLSTTTPQEWWNPMGPQAAACLSCHDSDDARAHAYTNTAFFGDIFGESCGTCHGEGKSASVDKVHAR